MVKRSRRDDLHNTNTTMLDPLLEWGLEDALEAAIEEAGCCDASDLLDAFGDEISMDPLLQDRLKDQLLNINF